ncbi:MAG: (2R)-3-sulfolactate dehydrogenase (NADP+) [Octadecabacter sp.]|jgi:(2R)-3-sulfolactate dehydrogenase (NADP+)
MKILVSEIEDVAKAAMVAHGAHAWQAGEVAKAVARAEAFGNVICGLYYLESYCTQLKSGRVDGQVDPIITRPKRGQVIADARFGFSQPAFSRGLEQAVQAARENGTATLAVAHAHTCTSLGFFTEQISAAGLIGIGFTNASSVVAPPNGKLAVIGTNPISMSIPNGGMHWDFSTSAVALGKITMAKAAGEKIPLGWAVNEDGKPTTDPGAALKGALVSAGGYKGWGFGLMAEVLAAGMTGSVNSLDVTGLKLPNGKPHDLGQFYIMIEPGADFGSRLSRIAQAIAEQDGTRIPGQNRQPMTEINVPDTLWSASRALAAG